MFHLSEKASGEILKILETKLRIPPDDGRAGTYLRSLAYLIDSYRMAKENPVSLSVAKVGKELHSPRTNVQRLKKNFDVMHPEVRSFVEWVLSCELPMEEIEARNKENLTVEQSMRKELRVMHAQSEAAKRFLNEFDKSLGIIRDTIQKAYQVATQPDDDDEYPEPGPGRPKKYERHLFTVQVALEYQRILNEKPKRSGEGVFACVLKVALEEAGDEPPNDVRDMVVRAVKDMERRGKIQKK